jgi:hypothetical protein
MTTHKAHPKAPDHPHVERLATRAGVEPVYPRWAHQVGGASQVVYSEEEALALGDDWNWVPPPPPPMLTALEPATVAIGDASFTLHVRGTGFLDGAVIVFADHDEPTTWVSPTEVTTGVDMAVWLGPDTVPVTARNADDGAVSNALDFVFTDPPAARSRPGHGHSKPAAHEGD